MYSGLFCLLTRVSTEPIIFAFALRKRFRPSNNAGFLVVPASTMIIVASAILEIISESCEGSGILSGLDNTPIVENPVDPIAQT